MKDIFLNFHFIRPAALLLAPVAIGLWFIWRRRSDPLRGWRDQMDAELLEALAVNHGANHRGTSTWLLVAWLLAILALGGPTWKPEPSPFAEDASPLMILLKADAGMDRTEPAPSCIERAHLKISDIAQARKGQPLGLIAYAGSAHLVLPPTRDTEAVADMAAELSSAVMPIPGDRPDLAVRKAAEVLGASGGSLLILAESLGTDSEALAAAIRKTGLSVQVLSINSATSAEHELLQSTAKEAGASVQILTADDTDISKAIRRAASTPLARQGELGDRWQEAGWYLVPLLAIMIAISFRRETPTQEAIA
jgi:Ca-activated chloride channel family protein